MEIQSFSLRKLAAEEHLRVGMSQLEEDINKLSDTKDETEIESQICELVGNNISFMFSTLMKFVRESHNKVEMREILLMVVHEYRLRGFESQFAAAQSLADDKDKQRKLLEEKKSLESQLQKEKLEKLKVKADLRNIEVNQELQLKKRIQEYDKGKTAELEKLKKITKAYRLDTNIFDFTQNETITVSKIVQSALSNKTKLPKSNKPIYFLYSEVREDGLTYFRKKRISFDRKMKHSDVWEFVKSLKDAQDEFDSKEIRLYDLNGFQKPTSGARNQIIRDLVGSRWFGPFSYSSWKIGTFPKLESLVFNTVTHDGVMKGLSLVLCKEHKTISLYYRDGNSEWLGMKSHVGLKPQFYYDSLCKLTQSSSLIYNKKLQALKAEFYQSGKVYNVYDEETMKKIFDYADED